MSETRPGIALFGGTFDPVHEGHVAMAQAARTTIGLARVVFIPCALSPHKTDGPSPTPGGYRMDMIRIVCERHSWLEADDCELERAGASYSWQTAEHFRVRFPDARLFWILGEDQWQALPRWSRPEQLATLVEFIVFSRNHLDPSPRQGFRARFMPAVHEASATEIRNALRAGDVSCLGSFIDPGVMAYIRSHGLYGTDQ